MYFSCILYSYKRLNYKWQRNPTIINDFHILPTEGHASINRMFNNIRRRYVWHDLFSNIEKFVRKCVSDSEYYTIKKQLLSITTTSSFSFQKIFLDLVGPLETDENIKYILTNQCDLSKFVGCYPIPNKKLSQSQNFFLKTL